MMPEESWLYDARTTSLGLVATDVHCTKTQTRPKKTHHTYTDEHEHLPMNEHLDRFQRTKQTIVIGIYVHAYNMYIIVRVYIQMNKDRFPPYFVTHLVDVLYYAGRIPTAFEADLFVCCMKTTQNNHNNNATNNN